MKLIDIHQNNPKLELRVVEGSEIKMVEIKDYGTMQCSGCNENTKHLKILSGKEGQYCVKCTLQRYAEKYSNPKS